LRSVPLNPFLHILQQQCLPVQLVPNLQTELALPANTCAQLVQLIVLVAEKFAVVLVNLLVVEGAVVGCRV
jgi:hypothetical protein